MHLQERNLVIYGASGHGNVIADIVEKNGQTVLAFVDDNEALWNQSFCGYPVWGGYSQLIEHAGQEAFSVIIAVGDNRLRWKIRQKLESAGVLFGTAVHPSAQLGRDVSLGAGTVVMANSVINPGARVGSHCLVNTAVSIDHDCVIGDFTHLSPGAHLGGTVQVEDFSWIGLGASVINNIHVGEHSIVGAGAVVIRNVESYTVVVGNPATKLKSLRQPGGFFSRKPPP
jgi:sugar O-acyltransferase (sialic acid O-acetyltransferase NeuD family)